MGRNKINRHFIYFNLLANFLFYKKKYLIFIELLTKLKHQICFLGHYNYALNVDKTKETKLSSKLIDDPTVCRVTRKDWRKIILFSNVLSHLPWMFVHMVSIKWPFTLHKPNKYLLPPPPHTQNPQPFTEERGNGQFITLVHKVL